MNEQISVVIYNIFLPHQAPLFLDKLKVDFGFPFCVTWQQYIEIGGPFGSFMGPRKHGGKNSGVHSEQVPLAEATDMHPETINIIHNSCWPWPRERANPRSKSGKQSKLSLNTTG